MAKDYSSSVAVTLKKIKKFGREVTLRKISEVPRVPGKPWRGSDNIPSQEVTAHAAFMDPVSEKILGHNEARDIDGIVLRGGSIAFIAAGENPGVDLTEFSTMEDRGLVYSIERCEELTPGATPILYEMELKR